MDTRILAFALAACAAGFARGNQYPAGLDPRSCPDYPNCDNAALHGPPAATAGTTWNSVAPIENSWESWESRDRWNAAPPAPVAASARYPAGVDPQSCPDYPDCDNAALHGGAPAPAATLGPWGSPGSVPRVPAAAWNPAPEGDAAPAATAPQYPAGVNARICPNYPYCA